MKYFLIACLLGLASVCSTTAKAAVLIDVEDATITAGGMQFVDVLITSDANDNLDLFNYEFTITSLGGASTLEFEVPQDVSEDTDPNYVLAGDNVGIGFFTETAALIDGGDLTASGAGVVLDATPRLLARLDLQHVLGGGQTAAMAAGEQFTITLSADPFITFFDDELGDPIAIDAASFTNIGTVTVAAAAVPEPSSLAICGLALIPALRRRRR